MERTYESAMALVSRATGPLAAHLGPWVSSLIDKQYVCAVVYVKARHAVAFDRWLPGHRIQLEDLSEAHLTQYQDRRRRVRRPIRAATRQQERRELVHLLRDLRDQLIARGHIYKVDRPSGTQTMDAIPAPSTEAWRTRDIA